MRRFVAIAVGVITVMGGTAQAQPLAIEVDDGLPFTAAELEAAVSLRLNGAASRPLRVLPTSDEHRVVVAVGTSRREVDLGEATGVAAARRVALVSLDLFREAERAAATPPIPAATPAPIATARITVPQPTRRDPLRIGIGGYGQADGAAGATIAIDVPVAGPVAVGGRLGAAVREPESGTMVLSAPLRGLATLRMRRGNLSLTAGAGFAVDYHSLGTDDGDARYHDSALRWGAAASVGMQFHVTRRLAVAAEGGADLYGSKQRYLVGDDERFRTEYLQPWGTVGVSIALGVAR